MDDIKKQYDANNSWGILTSLDLHNCKPEYIRSADKLKEFVVKLCDLIKVNRFGECTIVHFGEKEEIAGFSLTQLIETSLVSGHFANKTNNSYIDIFSCKYYDPQIVADFCKDFFEASDYNMTYLFRK
jgi:S-adenosylmethionine/arginine decarboxylase-like enzyme